MPNPRHLNSGYLNPGYLKPRHLNWLIAFGCGCLLAITLLMEYQLQLEPCPLCMMQRAMVALTGAIALTAACHHPGGTGIRLYGILTMLAAGLGGGLAARQLWLQSLSADQIPACGAGLEYLLEVFPLIEVLQMVLAGDGTCATVNWTFLGISIPGWALIGFMLLMAAGLLQVLRPRP